MASTPGSISTPIYRTPHPFFRLFYGCRLYTIKFLAWAFFRVLNLPGIRNRSHQPTFTKVYPVQSSLRHRVFIPKSYKSDDAPLPLYLDLHGGGFALLAPYVDDEFCTNFSNDNKVLVISLEYPLAPGNPYPKAVNALVNVVNAVLEDKSLPFDRKKVAIGGSSAGGNLTLAIVQDKSLHEKVQGVVSFYPPVDFTTPLEVNLARRPEHAGPDPLENGVRMFNWGYFTDKQDLKDPQLSVRYAQRATLPPKLCIIGCDFDLLCKDAEIMAEELGSVGPEKRKGTDDCWERNGVRWERVMEEPHGILVPWGASHITRR
jgi:acetyl esterase/lipase